METSNTFTANANDALTPARSTGKSKGIARVAPHVARILLGLVFFVFGLAYFLNFMPAPKELPPKPAMDLSIAMMNSGYLFALIKGTEVLVGALLLCNRFVPLALALIAPVLVNIVAFHAFLAPADIAIPVGLVALELYLAWTYRAAFRPMLAFRTPSR